MKQLVIFFLLLLAAPAARACDHCACGAANYYIGVMPQFNRHFAGVRYRYADFSTMNHIGHGGTREQFQVAELWGRFYPTRKIQVLGFLPYQINRQMTTDEQFGLHGFGDATVLANYNILQTSQVSADRVVRHSAWVGGGVKAPTGRYRFNAAEQGTALGANANLQLGTGSWDFLVNGQYTLRFSRLGLSTDVSYRHNGVNANDYHFGDRISGTLAAFYVRQFGAGFAVMPSAGIYAEYSDLDRDRGAWIADTGGEMLCAQAGLDFYFNGNYAVNVGWQRPFYQTLLGGHTTAGTRLMGGVVVMF